MLNENSWVKGDYLRFCITNKHPDYAVGINTPPRDNFLFIAEIFTSMRLENALIAYGCKTVQDVKSIDLEKFSSQKGVGPVVINELKDLLSRI